MVELVRNPREELTDKIKNILPDPEGSLGEILQHAAISAYVDGMTDMKVANILAAREPVAYEVGTNRPMYLNK